jgi:hypothetical protein
MGIVTGGVIGVSGSCRLVEGGSIGDAGVGDIGCVGGG